MERVGRKGDGGRLYDGVRTAAAFWGRMEGLNAEYGQRHVRYRRGHNDIFRSDHPAAPRPSALSAGTLQWGTAPTGIRPTDVMR
jgi:hypothetical protein